MKTIYFILMCLMFGVALNAQNDDFVPSSSYVVFKASDNAPTSRIRFDNKSGIDLDIGSLSIIGADSNEFSISDDGCSDKTVSGNNGCNVEVKFVPKTNGTKNALLEFPYGLKKLYIFLTNHEDNEHNVRKRITPVAYDINISETLEGNTTYTFKWSIVGYHKGYKVCMAMFDCTDQHTGGCGDSYDSPYKFVDSGLLNYDSKASANWTYHDQKATKFNYTYTTKLPVKRPDSGDTWSSTGTKVVVRFYVLSEHDEKNSKPSISLIIPGNLSKKYYDTSGRKIEKTMCPEDGCSE